MISIFATICAGILFAVGAYIFWKSPKWSGNETIGLIMMSVFGLVFGMSGAIATVKTIQYDVNIIEISYNDYAYVTYKDNTKINTFIVTDIKDIERIKSPTNTVSITRTVEKSLFCLPIIDRYDLFIN